MSFTVYVCADPNTQTVPAYPPQLQLQPQLEWQQQPPPAQQLPYPVQQPYVPQQLQGMCDSVSEMELYEKTSTHVILCLAPPPVQNPPTVVIEQKVYLSY